MKLSDILQRKYRTDIYLPGSTKFLSISVPVAVAFITQTWADSKASCPWSPHSLHWDGNRNILKLLQAVKPV